MSKAIATVTEGLRQMLLKPVDAAIDGASVETLRLDDAGAKEGPFVNVYLYQTSPNAALRNADVPTRAADGRLTQKPRAALDLHYLITAHGKDSTLDPQVLLGAVVLTLHRQPFLTQAAMAAAMQGPLMGSDLAQSPETVKFTPVPLSIEELSKLWSVFFQTKYALSAAYIASVVFVEGEEVPATPLPVQSHRVVVIPSLGPRIDSIASQATATSPILENQVILSTFILHLVGRGLRSDTTIVRIGNSAVTPLSIRDDRITIKLDSIPAADLRAGLRTVKVVHPVDFGTPVEPHQALESNTAAFMLAPEIDTAVVVGQTVEFEVIPDVRAGQRLVVSLNENQAVAPLGYSFSTVAQADGKKQVIPIGDIAAGKTYIVRLRVDGAESPVDVTNPITVTT